MGEENSTVAPTDHDTLRERLLASRAWWEDGRAIPTDLEREAAEAITQLQAKVERLESALREIADATSKRQLPLTTQVNDIARNALSDKVGG